ncbi:glycosyltransferase family 39 protein [Legionella shakespearei]|uniref:Uncharacterized protein n=1 Tax=Legionella shakespearei DSM 23087 TaxID=1122169 RepID=A0A0W0YV11_9GAMM|nr:glycosyltransferase family 39 protein [Legionella shakespearei]KTD60695.1 hypothetical protein Lsha_1412 [Legionella shakespearei DSM 23087]
MINESELKPFSRIDLALRNIKQFFNQDLSAVLLRPFVAIAIFFMLGKLFYSVVYLTMLKKHMIDTDLLHNICHWDCDWYKSIIYHGYDQSTEVRHNEFFAGQFNWPFFPLFPLLAKGLIAVFKTEWSVLVFNQILLFSSMLLLYNYAQKQYTPKTALMAACLLGISCENIYIFTFYTESLFLFLSLSVLYYLIRERYILAALCCGLLSATRIQGCIMVIPLLYEYWKNQQYSLSVKNVSSILLLGLLSLSGLLLFMVYLKILTNDFLMFYHIQVAWGRFHQSWWNPIKALMSLKAKGINKIFPVLSLCVIYFFYKHKKIKELLFFSLCFLLPIMSQNLMGYTRYFFANYASYLFLAHYGTVNKRRFYGILFFTIVLNLVFTYRWLLGKASVI